MKMIIVKNRRGWMEWMLRVFYGWIFFNVIGGLMKVGMSKDVRF